MAMLDYQMDPDRYLPHSKELRGRQQGQVQIAPNAVLLGFQP